MTDPRETFWIRARGESKTHDMAAQALGEALARSEGAGPDRVLTIAEVHHYPASPARAEWLRSLFKLLGGGDDSGR